MMRKFSSASARVQFFIVHLAAYLPRAKLSDLGYQQLECSAAQYQEVEKGRSAPSAMEKIDFHQTKKLVCMGTELFLKKHCCGVCDCPNAKTRNVNRKFDQHRFIFLGKNRVDFCQWAEHCFLPPVTVRPITMVTK